LRGVKRRGNDAFKKSPLLGGDLEEAYPAAGAGGAGGAGGGAICIEAQPMLSIANNPVSNTKLVIFLFIVVVFTGIIHIKGYLFQRQFVIAYI